MIAGVRAEVGEIPSLETWELGQDGPELKEKPSMLPLAITVELLPICSPMYRTGKVCDYVCGNNSDLPSI